MTVRLARELEAIAVQAPRRPDDLVFGIADNVKRSFDTVRRVADLHDVRFHDLRDTASRRADIPLSEVGRVLGHTQANTTYRYVNANIDTARRAAAAWTPSIPKERCNQSWLSWQTEADGRKTNH
jgi:integrase